MIQEILDYLLTRCLLLNSTSQELIDNITDKETFSYVVKNISNLMQKEDFVLIDRSLQEKVSDIIQSHRFDYNKDKELNAEMNYIIGRLQDYKSMSTNRKNMLIYNWIKQETEVRGLPVYYREINILLNLVCYDAFYMKNMLCSSNGQTEIDNVVEYLSLINLILNKYTTFFDENQNLLKLTIENCEIIAEIKKIPKFILKMDKDLLKKLNKNNTLKIEGKKKKKSIFKQ